MTGTGWRARLSSDPKRAGRRADLDAEDLVGIALLAMVAKPPNPKAPAQLHHWLRTVMWAQNARRFREFHRVEVVSWDGLQESRAQRVSE
jgi:DNA-directed RNA polymerase specialized sigma24 family protein